MNDWHSLHKACCEDMEQILETLPRVTLTGNTTKVNLFTPTNSSKLWFLPLIPLQISPSANFLFSPSTCLHFLRLFSLLRAGEVTCLPELFCNVVSLRSLPITFNQRYFSDHQELQMAVYTDCDVNIQGYSSNVIAGDQIIHTYGNKPGAPIDLEASSF